MNGYEATRAIRQLTGKAKSNIPIIGTYATCSGFVKKIDRYAHTVMMTDQTIIPVAQNSDIEGEMFGDMYYQKEVLGYKQHATVSKDLG